MYRSPSGSEPGPLRSGFIVSNRGDDLQAPADHWKVDR